MRSKDEILGQLENSYSKTVILDERMIINSNLLLEVLIDIRDIIKDLSRMIAVQTGSTDIS